MPREGSSKQDGSGRGDDLADNDFQKMQSVYLKLSVALKQVGGMMDIANRLYCTNRLSTDETRSFTAAMVEITECLEEWQSFFGMAADTSKLEDRLIDLDDGSLSGSGDGDCLQDQDARISFSPLVRFKPQMTALFPLTPLHRASKACKPQVVAIDVGRTKFPTGSLDTLRHEQGPVSVSPAFELPITRTQPLRSHGPDPPTIASNLPTVRSPNFSCPLPVDRRLSGITSRRLSGITSRRFSLSSVESMDLIPPVPLAEFPLESPGLVADSEVTSQQTSPRPVPETPTFGKSLLRTRKPLTPLGNGSLTTSEFSFATPVGTIPTPYSTPGSVFSPLTPFSISNSSVPLVDDITASAIKRIGVKGLEEELWNKLKAWNIDTNLKGGGPKRLRLSRRASKLKHEICGKENLL